MKMSNYTTCCEKCFWKLVKKSSLAAQLWVQLCDEKEQVNILVLNRKELNAIRKLELLGFLITTDIFNDILIKVTGIRKVSNGLVFCGGLCNGK